MTAIDAIDLIRGGGVLAFAAVVLFFHVRHATRVEKLIDANTAAYTRIAIALEALTGQVREVRSDVDEMTPMPVDGPRGRYHVGRVKGDPR